MAQRIVSRNSQHGQGRYWMLTIPWQDFLPFLPDGVSWIKGQLERGSGGFLHWQIVVAFPRAFRRPAVKRIFGTSCHCELSRSSAANEYVCKDDTAIVETRFELGKLLLKRNSRTDWDQVRQYASNGRFEDVPSDIFVRCYHQLRSIRKDFDRPIATERSVYVFWGKTGTGKSRDAWQLAGELAYPKDPNTKFWDGYQGESCVVMDEFRGKIDISHLLRWFDRYPCRVEVKGSSVPLVATQIWITSNLSPREWYPDLDDETFKALSRRINVTHYHAL